MSSASRGARHPYRARTVVVVLMSALVLLAGRAVYLQVVQGDYLQVQGNQRHSRVVKDNSHRGMILDRYGAPLAVSTPVESVWAHPATLADARASWAALARLLEITPRELAQLLDRHRDREFMYLKRHVSPTLAEQVTALNVPGVSLLREYRRYYPAGASAGHALGFTNIDDTGQEGIELAYNPWLSAVPGRKRLLRDLHGNAVEQVESLALAKSGRDLVLSIDRRIQYLAYRELKAAIERHQARAGAVVVLDVHTGEVLALVNEPDFNPNNRTSLKSPVYRNRAITDLYEPGSTMKPFTIAAAIESGRFNPRSFVDTAPGAVLVGHKTIRDTQNHGRLTLAGVLEKSSNVGATRIALSLNKQTYWETLRRFGFGDTSHSNLPGEAEGRLHPPSRWVPIDQASLSFGYGISVTPLQLARAYAAIANGGELKPVSMLRLETAPAGSSALSAASARALQRMLEQAVMSDEGTGRLAQVPDYRVAGKTGTVRKLTARGYADDRFVAWFAGFAPATNPRLVMVVMIDEPARGGYFGGQVAAPVFSRVMGGALRLLDIPADAIRPAARPAVRGTI
ncbi:MAG: cell division protein [Candidatus Muproteobacteria bacterium RBG_16_62_13]|uniref:Peptidoglycan D,D-transpeptidase FtsI n=1 Tax=Candidatus Muproteobacteria bacterium RBG_16_62_13 TaxID=1817756 RepID=A0A1F6SZG0_9PROT|nr:MAG: cell division protein [Candidatus Muproteobacteria bacterium RBG_16_62_13]